MEENTFQTRIISTLKEKEKKFCAGYDGKMKYEFRMFAFSKLMNYFHSTEFNEEWLNHVEHSLNHGETVMEKNRKLFELQKENQLKAKKLSFQSQKIQDSETMKFTPPLKKSKIYSTPNASTSTCSDDLFDLSYEELSQLDTLSDKSASGLTQALTATELEVKEEYENTTQPITFDEN